MTSRKISPWVIKIGIITMDLAYSTRSAFYSLAPFSLGNSDCLSAINLISTSTVRYENIN